MVNSSKKFRDVDKKQNVRIFAKNGLESYFFNMKTIIDDEAIVTRPLSCWIPTSSPRCVQPKQLYASTGGPGKRECLTCEACLEPEVQTRNSTKNISIMSSLIICLCSYVI